MTAEDEAIEYLKGRQLHFLKKKFRDSFPSQLKINEPLQFSSFIDQYIDSRPELSEDEKMLLNAQMQNEAITSNVLHTEFESFADFEILKTLTDKYWTLNPDLDKNQRIYYGTIYSSENNAELYFHPDLKVYFMLFDGDLIKTCLIISKLIAQSLPFNASLTPFPLPLQKEPLIANLSQDNELTQRIILGLFCCINNIPGTTPPYILTDDHTEYIAGTLLQSMEFFVFSHEMGHFWHKDETSTDDPEGFARVIKISWRQEYNADLHGLNQVVNLFRNTGDFLDLMGSEIFLHFLILREKSNPELAAIDSHPPAAKRLEVYRQFLRSFLSDKEQILMEYFQVNLDILFAYYDEVLKTVVADKDEFFKKHPLP